ncbi:MAG: hypothetical protein GF411_19290 [Candidatus Lokiarchaeota archaeon]|nr:hypothetical protein [Candidatus Lokiarchaeota archaeon]
MNQTQTDKDKLVNLIKTSSMSSIDIMSERLEISVEETLALIHEAIDEGLIQGTITEDESRFYRTDIDESSEPSSQKEIEILKISSPVGKYVIIIGFASFIAGQVLVRLEDIAFSYDLGASLVVGSLFIIALGMFFASRVRTEKREYYPESSARKERTMPEKYS